MKKKIALSSGVLLIIGMCLFIPSIQTLAISALSIFRVNDAKTITITMTDIEEMMNYPFVHKEIDKEELAKDHYSEKNETSNQFKPEIKDLDSIHDFHDYRVKLPRELKNEDPQLYYTESQIIHATVDTEKINGYFDLVGLPSVISSEYDGKEVIINYPSTLTARYEDVTLFTTQGIFVENGLDVIEGIWSDLLNLPFLTSNLRSQLATIDLSGRDVYLPIIMGLGRETSIGNQRGYIYSTRDLMQVYSSFLEDSKNEITPQNEGASALLWTKNGVLYCLTGAKSDAELSKIARSIH
jgi:hypothetical protein